MSQPFFGMGFRRRYAREIAEKAEGMVLEIIPDHFLGRQDELRSLSQRHPIVFHDVGLSLATANDRWRKARLEWIRPLVDAAQPILFSDHVALTRSPEGFDLGHLGPVLYSEEQLAILIDNIGESKAMLGIPFVVENMAAPFVFDGGDMDEPEFFRRLTHESDSGLLLDVTNLVLNARNFGATPEERMADYPLERVWQLHLAGGADKSAAFWVDSHSGSPDDETLALLKKIRERAAPRAVIVERDANYPSFEALLNDVANARAAWEAP